MQRRSLASVILFLGSTLCFFLPFAAMSCGDVKVITLSGQQLAIGTTIPQPQVFGPAKEQKIGADPFAMIAVACSVAGVLLSLLGRKLAGSTAISGVVGLVSLLAMKAHMNSQIQKQGMALLQIHYEFGYTLAVLLLISGAAWNVYLFLKGRTTTMFSAPAAPKLERSTE